jgi:outer membrane protein assembly factor BamE
MPFRHIATAALVLLVAACGWMPTLPVLSPYKMDIQQGNIVTQEMVAKLQPGMSRSQVRFVLGTPLVADMFHADRWDYVYRLEKAGKLVEERKIVAVFSGDKLVRIDGDVVPAAAKPAAKEPAPADKPAAKP